MYVVNLDMNLECAGFKDRFVNCLNKQKPKEPPPPKKKHQIKATKTLSYNCTVFRYTSGKMKKERHQPNY